MQRLRRIKQPSLSDMVYPATNYIRFEHSLAVMHVASLLHDVGHPPFSYAAEELMPFKSESSSTG